MKTFNAIDWIIDTDINKICDAGRGYGHNKTQELSEDFYILEKPKTVRKQVSGSFGLGEYAVMVIEYDHYFIWKMFDNEIWEKVLDIFEIGENK